MTSRSTRARGRLRLASAAITFAALLGSARPSLAFPQDAPSAGATDSAEEHFRHGVTLYKDTDYEGALVEFRRAQALSPNYRVLYNIGQSLYQLQRYAEALTAFQSYLLQGGAEIAAARRAAVEGDLKALRLRVGEVIVSVNVDGAEVRIDDQIVGTSPLAAPVLVSVGHRKIVVAKVDGPSVERFVDVAVGDHTRVAIEFPTLAMDHAAAPPAAPPSEPIPAPAPDLPAAPPPLPPPAPGPDASSGPARSSVAWIPWTVTGVLAVGTAVTGALALTSKTALSNDLAAFPGNPDAISEDRNRAKGFALASDVLLGATALSLGVSVYMTIREHRPEVRAGVAAPTKVRLRFGLGRAQIEGDF